MTVKDRIETKLASALTPVSIEVIDESHKHAGHAHAVTRPGTAGAAGETHFRIKVVAETFRGKSLIDRHRSIHHLLETEFAGGMHALAIEAKAPGE
ncbi:MAG TPA: BolA family protein [Methylocella sp.]|nr:BolA family protein [Methylocella sp.]